MGNTTHAASGGNKRQWDTEWWVGGNGSAAPASEYSSVYFSRRRVDRRVSIGSNAKTNVLRCRRRSWKVENRRATEAKQRMDGKKKRERKTGLVGRTDRERRRKKAARRARFLFTPTSDVFVLRGKTKRDQSPVATFFLLLKYYARSSWWTARI